MDQETIHNQKTPKKPYIKLFLAAALIILVIGAILVSTNLLNTEEPQQLADPLSFRMFDDRTIEITKYEMFYRDNFLYSKEAVEFFSLSKTIEKFALFYHLEQHDYKWDEEKRDFFRERIKMELEYDKRDANLNAYYEKMFATLKITEEEYIEYYVLVNREFEMLYQDLFNKGIGLDETGAYPSGEVAMAYSNLMGITEDEMNELAEKIPERLNPMEPQPDLPFITDDFGLKVTTNAQGEYIFVENTYLPIYLDEPYNDILYELKGKIVKEELTRYSIKRYREAVASYESEDAQKMKSVKELGLMLEILERTIEMEWEL
ncbi:hypothetical protein [Psychrobacillus vulpis]|uniref:Uncharacterized protein n=1 Tax=Psychrobacillus vulpis TaxID=2325572 RepID=A0A544TPR3_9BACI|nr:hypothetical protein [Psychrobacillus vulpis]TQR19436.1 hypothetical protein FG384_12355 [Psychrobacillus vulpis]